MAIISLCLNPNLKYTKIIESLSFFVVIGRDIHKLCRAHEIICRAHEIRSAHEIICRAHEIISRAHKINMSCARDNMSSARDMHDIIFSKKKLRVLNNRSNCL